MGGENPSVYTVKEPKARKDHICCECRRIIKKGEHYQKFTGCWGGEWHEFKTCEECAELRDEATTKDDGAPDFGELEEWAREAGFLYPPDRN